MTAEGHLQMGDACVCVCLCVCKCDTAPGVKRKASSLRHSRDQGIERHNYLERLSGHNC